MYLGIINGWEEGHFKAVSEKGLKGIEFCINYNRDSAEALAKAADIKAYSEKYGVKVGSIGRWGMERTDENGNIKCNLNDFSDDTEFNVIYDNYLIYLFVFLLFYYFL